VSEKTKLVPVEPTYEMLRAAQSVEVDFAGSDEGGDFRIGARLYDAADARELWKASSRLLRMRKATPKSARSTELAKIHIAAQQLGLRTPFDDTAYRDMLWSVGRVRSAKDLDAAGRDRVLKHLRGCGFQDRPKAGEARYKPGTRPALIRWLWTCLANAGVVRDRSDRALRRYIAQHAGIPHPSSVTELAPQHIDGREQDGVIEQLKNWCRARKVKWE
jgi:phage gp16-like protein